MAQTGYTPILIYSSSSAATAPVAGNLTNSTLGSELAINITDGKLFYKDNVNAVQVIGWKVVPATAGGTGQTSYAVGDILYADTATSLAKLADVATGNALISGGVGVAPAWGKIGLTTHVTGTLPVANGGTGTVTAFTTGSVVFAGASGVYSQDNANLFWDDTNNRLGIGTTSPQSALSFASNSVISVATLDGSDNGIIALAGGGASSTARGGIVECRGNEATLPGIVDITSGNVANSYVSIQGRSASSYIRFATNATEAMRIFSSQGVSIGNTTDPGATNLSVTGSAGIGQTTAAGKLHVRQDQNGVTRSIIQNRNGSGTPISELTFLSGAFDLSDDRYAYIQSAGGNVPYIDFGTSNGAAPVTRVRISAAGETLCGGTTDNGAYNLQCNGTAVWGAGAYVNGSDARIKEDIAAIDSGLDVVAKLNPVTYRYKTDWSNDQTTQTGFIAQELLVAMEGKNYAEGVVQQGGTNGYYSVAYQNIIPILTKAIQEQQALIDELTVRLASIEEKI